MSLKLKALGLGLLAAMAMAAFAVVNATAETGGHFTSDSLNKKTVITGTENPTVTHYTEFTIAGFKPIGCHKTSYDGTIEGNTVEHVRVTPTYEECLTTEGTTGEVTVHANECGFTFKVGKKSTAHNTVSIVCKGTKKYFEITHPNCTIRVPEQNLTGVSYTTDLQGGKHAITLDATVKNITTHFEGGICIFTGTTKVSEYTGSVTVEGFEDLGNDATHPYGIEGNRVNITATGAEG